MNRLEAFSEGVLAIITIMVLELKMPPPRNQRRIRGFEFPAEYTLSALPSGII